MVVPILHLCPRRLGIFGGVCHTLYVSFSLVVACFELGYMYSCYRRMMQELLLVGLFYYLIEYCRLRLVDLQN